MLGALLRPSAVAIIGASYSPPDTIIGVDYSGSHQFT